MRFILNIIWLVLSGFWMALGYLAAGIVCCVLIITIPFGIASFRIAGFALWPFGRTIVAKPTSGAISFVVNVIWFLVVGLCATIGYAAARLLVGLSITIGSTLGGWIGGMLGQRYAPRRH